MKDAAAKADSVRYGMSIDGMTISYTGEMPANKKIGFTINQINANAIVNSDQKVDITFNSQEKEVKNITLDALEPHKAVAIKTHCFHFRFAAKNSFISAAHSSAIIPFTTTVLGCRAEPAYF